MTAGKKLKQNTLWGNAKPIPTKYNGYEFRSRLEARWAVFFDAIGIHYEYEPEGFDLDGLWYLPDFWLPQVKMWAEVKPGILAEEELHKCRLLATATDKVCLLLEGTPALRSYWGVAPDKEEFMVGYDSPDMDYILDYDYLSLNRFYYDTGYPRERPATNAEITFTSKYEEAVDKARAAFSPRAIPFKYPTWR